MFQLPPKATMDDLLKLQERQDKAKLCIAVVISVLFTIGYLIYVHCN